MKKTVLHVGCGPYDPEALPFLFRNDEWHELRLDINPAVEPDIIGSITEMDAVEDCSVDGLYSSHNLEHLYSHEVPRALTEFSRVLKDSGIALITLPDIQAIASYVAAGNLEEALYISPAGPIAAIDIFWGLRSAIQTGNEFMAHRTGFTAQTLAQKIHNAGFTEVQVKSDGWNLWALAFKKDAERFPLVFASDMNQDEQESIGFMARLRRLAGMIRGHLD